MSTMSKKLHKQRKKRPRTLEKNLLKVTPKRFKQNYL